MTQLTQLHMIGIIVTLLCIIVLGIHSGKKVKSASDFSTGGKSASSSIVFGALISTLIGGSSTIGTAQLAYTYGITAWWFTLGTGLGCLVFALTFIKPFRESGCNTIQQIISNEYGNIAGIVTSVLNTIGIIFNIVAQFLAAIALLTAMFGLSPTVSAVITVLVMICYVVFGGVLGTGLLGLVKLVIVYMAVIFGTFIILRNNGGFTEIYNTLPPEYFDMFSRGFAIDVGSAISVILGVICGQTYLQIVLSGKSTKDSKLGTVLAAALLPPVGLGGVLIGMYMKINYPAIDPGQAFPLFVINNMPPVFGGVILAMLLIALVGTGSGMALGFGTIMTNDIYKKFINKNADSKKELLVNRIFIILVFIVSALLTSGNLQSSILTWGILATGLRGNVLLMPMCGALFFKDKIDSNFAVASSIFGIGVHLIGEMFLDLSFDPLFLGLLASFMCTVFGIWYKSYSIKQLDYRK